MNQNLLCIDYGEARLGLATASTPIAEPLRVIKKENAISFITNLIKQKSITAIVMGLSENQTAKNTKKFAKQLAQKVSLPIYFQDETLSTQETMQKLIESHAKKKKRVNAFDHYVAAAILQDFIDSRLPLHPPA